MRNSDVPCALEDSLAFLGEWPQLQISILDGDMVFEED